MYELLLKSKTLKELRLGQNNQLADDCCTLIGKGLLKAPSIRVVNMTDTRMGNKAASIFADVIKKPNGTMRDLDLSNNLFIMDDIEMLGHAYKESSIECLNLRANIISGEEICAFEQLLAPICNMTKRKFMF